MRLRLGLGVAVVAAVAATSALGGTESAASVRSPAGVVVGGTCSLATAQRLVLDRVAGVLCGAFLGPSSEAMVVSLTTGNCLPFIGWSVFVLRGGAWQPVSLAAHDGRSGKPPAAVGTDIRETLPIYRPGDGPCFPSGGTKARIWHWNGSRLVAGPWKQVTSADTYESGHFKTPSSNIVCDYFIHIGSRASESFVGCVIKSGLRPAPPRRPCQDGGYAGDRVYLGRTGRVQVPSCAGDPGPYVYVDVAKVLGYGKTWSGGGIRCTSATAGLTCRNKSGHGFVLSREHWRAF